MRAADLIIATSAALLVAASGPQAVAAEGRTLSDFVIEGPSMALALEAVTAAVSACKARGYNAGATVVDPRGGIRASLGSDGSMVTDANASRRKAQVTVAFKASGAEIAQRMKTDKAFADQIAANRDWLVRPGSLLISKNGKIFGAIGVEGHSSAEGHPHDDALNTACAQAGIDRIIARLN